MSTDLEGRTAVVTGASSGIGEGVARGLREAGMNLVVTARREAALESLAEELGQCAVVAGDMGDPAMPRALVAKAEEAFGGCDVVLNNAGVMHVGEVGTIDLEAVCQMVRVNVEGAYRLAYEALRHFQARGGGHLINVSSTLGTKVKPTMGAYAGTKHAIEALSEDLRAQTAGTGVKVSVLEPGLTQTHLQDHFPEHPADKLGVKRMATPEDMARTVRWVLTQPDHVDVPRVMVMPHEQPG